MFGAMQDRFDLSLPDEYIGFIELWSKTELFRRTGIAKEVFYKLSPRPRNFLVLFDLLMEEFAKSNNKQYWLQKTSPLRALSILEHYSGAKIVLVRRNLVDTVRSTWGLQLLRKGFRRPVRTVYFYVRQWKIMDRIKGRYSAVEVHYDELKRNTRGEVERVCRDLGLNPIGIEDEYSYRKNTSFKDSDERSRVMSLREERIVRVAGAIFRLVPLFVMSTSAELKSRLLGRKPIPLMPGTFGDLLDNLADRSNGSRPPN
jgi:hypothetical protein